MAGIYETFYKLTTDPFRLSPDHRFSFGHPSYKKAKAYMQYALQRGEGFIMVTGSPGTGKTTLINDMLSQIDDNEITVVSLLSTRLKPDDMLHMVATSLGIACDEVRKSTLLVNIKEALTHQHRSRRRVVLMVDEAQDLSEEVVEELRLLSNMQTGINLLLQVFLVGQEPLVKLVKKPEMEHLRQRIIAATHLEPLSIEDTAAFIVYRLKRAGWAGDPAITSNALESIYRFSGGVPRRINLICSRLLFFGAVEEKHNLEKTDIDAVVDDMQEEMLFGEGSGRPQPDTGPHSPEPHRSFAQRVKGAGSVAYAVPDKALEEPDPEMPLSDFFDVVAEKPEDLVMEVVPADLQPDARPTARIEPQILEQLPESLAEIESSIDVAATTDAMDDIKADPETEVTAVQKTVVRRDEPVITAKSEPARAKAKDRPAPQDKQSKKSRRKGWGDFFLSLVFMTAVASAAAVFFQSREIETLNLYQRLTAWLEEQGVSFVLPLKDPDEPGTAPRPEVIEQETGLVNGHAPEPEPAKIDTAEGSPQSPEMAVAEITAPGEADDAMPDSPGLPEADPAWMEQSAEDGAISVDSSIPVSSQPPVEVQSAVSASGEPVVAEEDVVSGVTETDSASAESQPLENAVQQVPEAEETRQAQEGRRLETSQSVPEEKEVAVASLTRSSSHEPIGELAVLKTGPSRIPVSLPSAFTSNGSRDFSLVDIRSQLKSGRWGAFGEPAALLPSTMNHCKDEGVRIQCWTAPQREEADSGADAAVYQIESTMDGFSSSGTFEVRYRIMETAMNEADRRAVAGSRMNVKPGWKVSEYETLCRIIHSRLIRCFGGKEGVFSYTSLR